MAYVPINIPVFSAAYAGAIAGMGVSNRLPTSTSASSSGNLNLATIAGAFAQSFDTNWNNAAAADDYQLDGIEESSAAVWQNKSPTTTGNTNVASTWNNTTNALIAIVKAGSAYFTAQGITPPVAGGIQLAGDLLGTGSTTLIPLVGSLTGIAGTLAMAATAALMQWNTATVLPTIGQAATGAATGATMSMIAQGALTTGGKAVISSGTGVTAGNVEVQTGGVPQIIVTPSTVNLVTAPLIFGTIATASTAGILRFQGGVQQLIGARTNGGASNNILMAIDATDSLTIGDVGNTTNLVNTVLTNIVNRSTTFYVQSAGGAADRLVISATGAQFIGTSVQSTNSEGNPAITLTPIYNGTSTIQFASTVTSAAISQANAAAGNGATLLIQAQSAVAAVTTGGALNLQSGTGTNLDGTVNIKTGNSTALSLTAAVATFKMIIQLGIALNLVGGGATPPLLATAGIGQANQPTTAAQNSWQQFQDTTGAIFWVPVWK